MKVKVLITQSCLTLCNPTDYDPPAPFPMEVSRQECVTIIVLFSLSSKKQVRQPLTASLWVIN